VFKRIVILLAFLCACAVVHAQNSNSYLIIQSNTSLNWGINTESGTNGIETDQTISNAITIKVKNRTSTLSVYVRASTFSSPSGFTAPSIPLKLLYVSDNSTNASNLITTPLTMTVTDQRLFTHAQHSANKEYSFNYDLIHTATNWAFPAGTYNYTLTFTFSSP
jgi:hypothetical protein